MRYDITANASTTGKKHGTALLAVLVSALLLTTLCGCGKRDTAPAQSDPVVSSEAAAPSGTVESSEAEIVVGRQDGERFEDVIILEGMEETVRYEHVRNDGIGFEMDYDYELFKRNSEPDCEGFVSCYDIPESPENYLEVRYNPHDAESVAAAVSAALSNEYEIIRESYTLDRAGSCIRIDASDGKGGTGTPDQLQMVYIIPAADGCRVATAHYSFESAEGFGRRFAYMMNTLSVLPGQGERRISDEQAVYSIRHYCFVSNPGLESMISREEYPVYWEILSSDGNKTVVVFRSYTGAQNRYYIDPVSGETTVTELVPGIINEEQQTGESLNVWDYLF